MTKTTASPLASRIASFAAAIAVTASLALGVTGIAHASARAAASSIDTVPAVSARA